MTNNINPKAKRLDSEERKKILNPDKIVQLFSLIEGKILADIGCGTGYFSIPIAKKLGPSGKVYAIDVDANMQEVIAEKILKEELTNIEFILSKEYNFIIDDNKADYVLIANVLHEIEEKKRFLFEARRILKKNGIAFIIEWHKKETTFGPALDERIDIEECKTLLNSCHFSILDVQTINEYFYLIKCIN